MAEDLQWNKATQILVHQPRNGGFALSTGRKPRVKWEIASSRVAASLVS